LLHGIFLWVFWAKLHEKWGFMGSIWVIGVLVDENGALIWEKGREWGNFGLLEWAI
jgi:hypothetical protein